MENKPKEGVSVKEIQEFIKKHTHEVFFGLALALAAIFSPVAFGGMILSVYLAAIGGILGVLFPAKIEGMCKKVHSFLFKQEKTMLLVLAVVALVIALFLPAAIFFLLGTHGGKDMARMAKSAIEENKKP